MQSRGPESAKEGDKCFPGSMAVYVFFTYADLFFSFQIKKRLHFQLLLFHKSTDFLRLLGSSRFAHHDVLPVGCLILGGKKVISKVSFDQEGSL
jgi:hypothetical protein